MYSRRIVVIFSAVLFAGFLAVMPGCEWFQASDPSQRQSPYIRSLVVKPAVVSCGKEYTISLEYDDPQGDIAEALVTLQHSEDKIPREETIPWPATLKGSARGTVNFPIKDTCDDKRGTWTFTVLLEDDKGHTSNILSGEIRFL